jgi:hypothetical protein
MTPRSLLFGLLALVPVAACSGNNGGSGFPDDDGGPSGSSSGGSGGSSGGSGGSSGSSSGNIGTFGDASTDAPGECPPCDPGNVNLPNSNCDLDCSGTTTPPASCDTGLPSTGSANDFAQAIGICQQASGSKWGLVSATYTRGYNSTAAPAAGQHSILGGFGSVIKPREGANLGVLSSGYANMCDDANPGASCAGSGEGDPYFKGAQAGMYAGAGAHPPGYPKSTAECPVQSTVFDTIGVTLQIRVPNNAQGFSFDFDFYSGEWPEYVCTPYNDSFVAWLNSTAWAGTGGDLNISFDSMNNPVSVNNGFFDRCTPNTQTGCSGSVTATAACAGGPSELQGTGFYNLGSYCGAQSTGGGATGWLTTKAPVKGGEVITLQFIIWDTGDQNWDSSVLVDNLTWYGTAQTTGTSRPPAQ